ncbi:putative WD repeat-containing protein C17D11.16 isoform X2 [Wolffia australiana]
MEEINDLVENVDIEKSEVSEDDREDDMELDTSKLSEEAAQALAAAKALTQDKGSKSSSGFQDISDALRELDMEHYDDEEDGVELFGNGIGDAFYASNDTDPYLNKNDDDDDDEEDEEIEDVTIKQTDAVIVCARSEDEVGHLEVWVYEDVDDETNMYVHHDVILPAFPLCTAWLDCNPKNGEKGNFIAVGSMEPGIEIWDLDLIDEVLPAAILGGTIKKKKKKKSSVKYKKGSHRDSVLGLSWNKEVRNVIASASADSSVKVWDVVTTQCALTLQHHSDKVQAVEWSRHSPETLLSGSFDQSIVMADMKSPVDRPACKWSVSAQVESIRWDPHNEKSFVVSLEDGKVQGFDARTASSGEKSNPCFTLHAHDKAVCSMSYNPSVPNLLATGSMDKMVKLWELSNNQPSCVTSTNPKVGAIFSVGFSEDSPFLLAMGGSKGKLKVWDILSDAAVANRYEKFSRSYGCITTAIESTLVALC